jgi:signal transduction histidine kinase
MLRPPRFRLREFFRPGHWPVRWRLTAVSAGLTLVILLVFALAVGRLVTDRIRDDFHNELQTAASALAGQIQVSRSPGAGLVIQSPRLDDYAAPNDAVIRILNRRGTVLTSTTGAPDLGQPQPEIVTVGSLEAATTRIVSNALDVPSVFVQYARSHGDTERTVDRLWLFLLAGVAGATLLATLAGLAVAGRAMRPISALTATARRIAETRDPSQRIPQAPTEDEVAELAATLEQMLRALDESRAETQQAMRRQREFVADASHELRTPLTSVLANLELLDASLHEGQTEEREMVDSAHRSSRRMSRLVSDLLLLARVDAGRTGERQECDLARVAAEALAEVRPVAGDHPIEAALNGKVPVVGDPDELHRMVLNLLENAIRHTPGGTRVDLHVEARNGDALLRVADNGPGIPPGLEDHVFGRFVRVAGSADTADDGDTGLGLAIVRAVAESHGGEVAAGKAPEGGAEFRVRLPLR